MSRSSKLVEKPFKLTLSFKNEKFNKKKKEVEREAGFFYYKRFDNPVEGEPQGEQVRVDFPLKFIWLESAVSVSGFSKAENTGVYSNEILTDPTNNLVKKYGVKDLIVKAGQKEIARGKWSEISSKVKDEGGKYCIPVYALMEVEGEWQIVRILCAGGSRNAWFKVGGDKTKRDENYIISTGFDEVEMPTGDSYQQPKFEYAEKIDSSMNKQILEATKRVDAYFEFMLSEETQEEDTIEQPSLEEYSSEY